MHIAHGARRCQSDGASHARDFIIGNSEILCFWIFKEINIRKATKISCVISITYSFDFIPDTLPASMF